MRTKTHHEIRLEIMVDDIAQSSSNKSGSRVVATVSNSVIELSDTLVNRLGMSLSSEKAITLASSKQLYYTK